MSKNGKFDNIIITKSILMSFYAETFMKICPKCQKVYKDEIRFCLSDGTPLVESQTAPTATDYEEPETVISRNYRASEEPIIIDFGKPETKTEPIMIDFSDVETVVHPPKEAEELPQVTVIEKPVTKTSNYALFLVLGLFIGGGLVLLTLFLARSFFSGENVNANNSTQNQAVTTAGNNAAVNSTANANQAIQTAAAKHEKPNPSADVNVLNGKVIAVNAYVRALPNKDSAEIDVLPIGDRLEIKDRENPTSPWYQVVCEHGTVGWMHGNTIAFN